MRGWVSIFAAGIFLIGAVSARADMAAATSPETALSADLTAAGAVPGDLRSERVEAQEAGPLDSVGSGLGGGLLDAPLAGASAVPRGPKVTALPAGPGSVSLFFVALGGVGAWHVGRSARKLHLGTVPEWYHTGGPAQVGHAVPLDLTFTPLYCRFEQPGCQRPPVLGIARGAPAPDMQSQCCLRVLAPRPPPLQAF